MTDRSYNTQCPVCLEDLFNEEGVAERAVAETMCTHLIHSDCLAATGRSLNADGKRFGVGGMGIRSGCPICNTPVSYYWTSSKEAAYFKAFWFKPIEDALLELGPTRMPVSCELVREKLKESSTLTESQKKHIQRPDPEFGHHGAPSSGFCKALESAGSVDYNVDQVMFSHHLTTRGIWKYDAEEDTLWHWEWGLQHPRLSSCATCGGRPPNMMICEGCKDSCIAPLFCNEDCQKSHWSKHKKWCKEFQIMKKGGTREELLGRLREAKNL